MSELSGEILGAEGAVPDAPEQDAERGQEQQQDQGRPDRDAIARRAHEISQSDTAGTDEENWHRAEAELRE